MKYNNILELDKRIEKIIDTNVKAYYTDWKNIDRPAYMGYKGSTDKNDKKLILIARECGTYLLKLSEVNKPETWSNYLIEYYAEQERTNKFYYIDIDNFEVKPYDITQKPKHKAQKGA